MIIWADDTYYALEKRHIYNIVDDGILIGWVFVFPFFALFLTIFKQLFMMHNPTFFCCCDLTTGRDAKCHAIRCKQNVKKIYELLRGVLYTVLLVLLLYIHTQQGGK